MRLVNLVLAMFLITSAAQAADLTWNDLVAKPELRPEQCTIKKNFDFQSGLSARTGQKMTILEFNPTGLVLGSLDGKLAFDAMPADTDVLETANAAYNALTPQQRALTVAEVLNRPDLWPYKLTLKNSFDVGRTRLNKGDTVYLMSVKNGELVVVPSTFDQHFELLPSDTDILEKARQYIEKPGKGRLMDELEGKLVDATTGQAKPIDPNALPKYIVLYQGARWCPYTQKFTPELLKAYNELKAAHPGEFEVVYLPAEKSAAELQTYAKEINFPWPTVQYQQKGKMAVLAGIIGRSSLPEIEVVDRHGTLIIDNYTYDREEVLVKLKELLK